MQWLRKLLKIPTPAEAKQAGRDYVDTRFTECDGDMQSMKELWHLCDGAFDIGEFDRGMRDRLRELRVPHPMDFIE